MSLLRKTSEQGMTNKDTSCSSSWNYLLNGVLQLMLALLTSLARSCSTLCRTTRIRRLNLRHSSSRYWRCLRWRFASSSAWKCCKFSFCFDSHSCFSFFGVDWFSLSSWKKGCVEEILLGDWLYKPTSTWIALARITATLEYKIHNTELHKDTRRAWYVEGELQI